MDLGSQLCKRQVVKVWRLQNKHGSHVINVASGSCARLFAFAHWLMSTCLTAEEVKDKDEIRSLFGDGDVLLPKGRRPKKVPKGVNFRCFYVLRFFFTRRPLF